MMKRILLGVLVILIVVQFIPPPRNVSAQPPGKNDIIVRYNPPAAIRDMLQHACYDCHSDNTRYPWYARVQPVGWWLANHIKDGKRHLNFSQFGAYDPKRQAKALDHVSDQVTNHTMPLRSYTWIHDDARLTPDQVNMLSTWADHLYDQIAPKE